MVLLCLSLSIAINNSTEVPNSLDDLRTAEINASINLFVIIIIFIIALVAVFLIVNHLSKKKYINRARRLAKNAKHLVNEAEKEELDDLEKKKELHLKSAKLKRELQEKLRLQRLKNEYSKKHLIFSEFDSSTHLKPSIKYSELFDKKKKDVFLNLDYLGKHKKLDKRTKQKKKTDSSIFDKLDEIKD